MEENRTISNILDQADKQSSFDRKREIYIKALIVSKTIKNRLYIPEIYVGLIQVYFHKDLYAKALFYIKLGQKYYKDDINYFLYFISAEATVHIYNNQFYEAKKLLICLYRHEDIVIYPEIYTQLSEIALSSGDVNKAIYYAKKSINISEEGYDLEQAYMNLIDLYRQENMLDEAVSLLEEARDLDVLLDFHYNFLKYNILVKKEEYEEAEQVLKLVERDLKDFPDVTNIVTAISLELFKKTNNEAQFTRVLRQAKSLNRNEIAMLWLIYDQAGDFYEKRDESRKALKYYKLSAIHLEKHRKKSNVSYENKLDFFRDKYYYLLDYSIFAYNMGDILNSFCFFELSKSSSLRDAIFVESLEYQEIKGYM